MCLRSERLQSRSNPISQAAESINKMVVLLSQSDIDTHFIPLLKRLSQGDWFTSRTSACALYATAYPRASPSAQSEMRKMFADLCHDDTPMVRRAAAKALGVSCVSDTYPRCQLNHPHLVQPFAKCFANDKETLLSEIVPLYKKLAADDQDSVRLLTIPDLIAIAEHLPPQEVKSELNVQLTAAYTDKSWRVRYMLADHFVEVGNCLAVRTLADMSLAAGIGRGRGYRPGGTRQGVHRVARRQ